MKAGLTLDEMAAKLMADKTRMQDYVVDTRELHVLTGEGGTEVKLPGVAELEPTQHFHRQLGTDLKVRADLYDRLRTQHPVQFDHLVNGLLDRWDVDHDGKPGKRMVRTYTDGGQGGQGVARAVLSDRYRRLDNFELAEAVLPIIGEIPNARVESCDVTETKLYLKVVAPLTQFNLQEFIDPSIHTFLPEGNPDYVQGGFVVTNSEVGNGALSVQRMLYRLVCRNGLIVAKAMRRTHVGANVTADDDGIVFRDETVAADDKALLMKVQDAVRSAVDETVFEQLAAQFAETASGEKIAKPVEAMRVLQPVVGLTDGETESVLTHLLAGGDLSQFGTVNAVTRMAQDVDSYDRSTELEELAATKVMAMPKGEWERVATAA